tara:strand:+ start:228 stop:329 length:102 start_codon:yes stop_codon:yes gene_type:complete
MEVSQLWVSKNLDEEFRLESSVWLMTRSRLRFS